MAAFRLIGFFILLHLALLSAGLCSPPEWVYLDNANVRVGIRKDAGACIASFSQRGGPNVLNSFDHGRFIQQSYYGGADGSLWVEKPWRYNPVQGGDYRGNAATVLKFEATATELYSKVRPKHWATGSDLPEVVMEQWIKLHDDTFHLRARMTYTGEKEHPSYHQEIPAVFVQPEYHTLLLHDGKELRRWQPGWPNEHLKLPQGWAIFLDDSGRGIGVFVPKANELTCYRFGKAGDPSACSYLAPITTFAINPGKVFEYHAWFTLGTEKDIRARFESLRNSLPASMR